MLSRQQTHLLRSPAPRWGRTIKRSPTGQSLQRSQKPPRSRDSNVPAQQQPSRQNGGVEADPAGGHQSREPSVAVKPHGRSRPFSPSQIRSAVPRQSPAMHGHPAAMASKSTFGNPRSETAAKTDRLLVPGVHVANRSWHQKSGLGIPLASGSRQPTAGASLIRPMPRPARRDKGTAESQNRHQGSTFSNALVPAARSICASPGISASGARTGSCSGSGHTTGLGISN